MKPTKLSHHIGNIDDRLVQQAGNMPDYGRQRRNRSIRRIISIAAVIALMAGSFAVGAFAITNAPDPIVIHERVYIEVEKEQELIVFGESGISLILPDWWEGKYEYEINDSGANADGTFINLVVYHTATRERLGYDMGILFGISFTEERRPLDYNWPWPAFTIAITEKGSYLFGYPSDVQFDFGDPVSSAEYELLSEDIKNIEIVMTTEMLNNTINMSNWVRGAVFVDIINEEWQVVGSFIGDEEQSRIIKEIIRSQDYRPGHVSFHADLRIMFDGEEFILSLTTGQIENLLGAPNNGTLSTEDLQTIRDIVANAG